MEEKIEIKTKILDLLRKINKNEQNLPVKEKKYNAFLLFASLVKISKTGENKNLITNLFKNEKEITAELASALEFTNCSCKNKVIKYIFDNWEKSIYIFSQIIWEQEESFLENLYELQKQNWNNFVLYEKKKFAPTPTVVSV
jgi:hypothetical protein